jgi:poly(beta-D-mannuronate) lyase
MNPVIGNDEENSRHNTVAYCHIKDIPYAEHNGREIMRIFGYGHADQMGNDGAYFTIEYNLFERAHGEGVEIISLKSNYNIVRYNTVRASRGGLVSRRGINNTIEGNFIFGENQEGTTGIRVAGQNHRVINNYICDVAEDGLRLITGEYYKKSLTNSFKSKKKDLPAYIEVQNCTFAHNTVVNAGENGINIGYRYKNQWPDLQMVLLPENNFFVNNLIYNCKNNAITMAVQDKNPPLDFLVFKPNQFKGNIVFGGDGTVHPMPTGIKNIDPKLVKSQDGLYRLSKHSPAINRGVKTDVVDDMDGQVRGVRKDVGGDQYSEVKSIRHPLTSDEVGPEWINAKRKAGENY